MHLAYQCCCCYIVNPRPEGYGSHFVVRSFIHSIYLSIALQRTAFTSSRQLRYEQAKHIDGLQSDGWILLNAFILELWLAHRDSLGTLLKTKTPIVGCPDTNYRFNLYCRTTLGVQRYLVKSLSTLYQSLKHRHLAT